MQETYTRAIIGAMTQKQLSDGLSQGNAFTLGYRGVHHGYIPGLPTQPTPVPQKYTRGGFGNKGGTIPGMGSKNEKISTDSRPSGLTIKKK